ncbi:MAG: hypothetical protein ABSC05_19815 [Candidatus Solibacter sp.]|jgi:hypothetical protein
MTRANLSLLPKESETRIEWVRARHEVKIRSEFLNWRREKTGARPPSLTAQQQSELQALLVARSVELVVTEGRERLSAMPGPSQFEAEIHFLVETVADEARDRWKSLTSAFHLEASTEGVYADAERGIYSRVRELLGSPTDRLILQAWSAHEKRLQAECGGDLADLRSTPEVDTGTGPAVSDLCVPGGRAETPRGRRANRLRIDERLAIEKLAEVADSLEAASPAKSEVGAERPASEGDARTESAVAAKRQSVVMPILTQKRWTRGKWVTESGVGKNCVYEYLDGKRNPGYENRKAMADALELKVEELPD